MIPRPSSPVVVTGLGAVSSWGWSVEEFWRGICGRETAIDRISRFDHDRHPTHLAAEVPPLPAEIAGRYSRLKRLSFADVFALVSAEAAIESAGLPSDLADRRAGVFYASSTGGMFEAENVYDALRRGTAGRELVCDLASQQVSGPGEAVAKRLRVAGPVETVSSACASGSLSIGLALDALRAGEVDVAVVGGSDSLCRLTFTGFNALRSVDPGPCRPFRADRAGLSLGEGAATLILEPLDRALTRGATPLAELSGAGAGADAHHMTAPHPEGTGAAAALRLALEDARTTPDQVSFINAHGTGTPLNDASEYGALESVFGERTPQIPVTAIKGSIGHLLGSAGAIEAVATVLCLHHRAVHPTPGPGELDPRAPVRLVRGEPLRDPALRVGVSLNLGFGGSNAALVFSRGTTS
jgi:3-oxoacyl-[acyl-carrier-protein] synthase II